MHNAIIHIGTEKTGSTAVQNFLYKNEALLAEHGYFFPYRSCGFISNFQLLVMAQKVPDKSLSVMSNRAAARGKSPSITENPDQWREHFTREHIQELENFRQHQKYTTTFYSSEHFHSRMTDENDITSLREFLAPHFDQITIVAYFRRQDRLAVSGHNTAVQGGATDLFKFESIIGKPNYYNYLSLLRKWSNVFGENNVKARIFAPNRLVGGDVSHDFMNATFSPEVIVKLASQSLQFERSNPRLSYSALRVLHEFNLLDDSHPLLHGTSKHELRQPLIKVLHQLKDDHGEVLPVRRSAQAFYDRFKEDNKVVFETWGDGTSFNEDFSKFPESEAVIPTVDGMVLLEKYVEKAV